MTGPLALLLTALVLAWWSRRAGQLRRYLVAELVGLVGLGTVLASVWLAAWEVGPGGG